MVATRRWAAVALVTVIVVSSAGVTDQRPAAGEMAVVASLSPDAGPSSGGTEVTISGSGFTPGTTVMFGTVAARWVRVESDSRMLVVAPAQPAGVAVHVWILGAEPAGESGPARFVYLAERGWSSAPPASMSTAIDKPRATGVGNVVLVTGCDCGSGQMYDPDTNGGAGTFTRVPDAAQPGHSATPLVGGRVLLAGGERAGEAVSSAIIIAPASPGTSFPAPSMTTPRRDHAAVPLPNGALVTGGTGADGQVLATSELYDAALDQWRSMPPMAWPRTGHTALLTLDGRVLVVGGQGPDGAPLASAEIYDPHEGDGAEWRPAAPMATRRARFAAALLPDGSVLVAGGIDVHDVVRSAERYVPAGPGQAGSWQPAGVMATARAFHTLTVVGDGRVLAAGGTAAGPVAAAELYDPSFGRWSATAAMARARTGHAATPLPDGRVFVVGGIEAEPPSAELFDPRPGVPAMRADFVDPPSSSTLGGSQVTIAGTGLSGVTAVRFGTAPAPITWASERAVTVVAPPGAQGVVRVTLEGPGGGEVRGVVTYAYEAGRWAPVEPLSSCAPDPSCAPRRRAVATRLDGIDCRRDEPPAWCGKVLVVGGGPDRTAQLYDPRSRTWAATGSLATERGFEVQVPIPTALPGPLFTSTSLPDGRVLVTGGCCTEPTAHPGTVAMSTAELYDPWSGTWSRVASMATPRLAHTATLLHGPECDGTEVPRPAWCGKVLVAGGTNNSDLTLVWPSAELYDPERDTWSPAGQMTTARTGHTATALTDGSVLATGGAGHTLRTCETGQTCNCGPGQPCDETPLSSAELYDPEMNDWRAGPAMAVPRLGHTATLVGGPACAGTPPAWCGGVLVAGGHQGGDFGDASAEVFEPRSGTWAPAGAMSSGRYGHAATVMPDGSVLVSGGGGGRAGSTADIFDPRTGRWRPAGSMAGARRTHAAVLLDGPACKGPAPTAHCGTVLAIGGGPRVGSFVTPLDLVEQYLPSPALIGMAPGSGESRGGTVVAITGSGFTRATAVRFGGVPAQAVVVHSESQLQATAPAHPAGQVAVVLEGPGGTSETVEPPSQQFSYRPSEQPGAVGSLAARAISETEVELSFAAPAGDGPRPPPARRYEARFATAAISGEAGFAAAQPLCGGVCHYQPGSVGERLTLLVSHLTKATTFHFAVRAIGEQGMAGPVAVVSVTTNGHAGCTPAGRAGPGQVVVGPGWGLVGGPAGTSLGTAAAVFSWSNQGAGGRYAVRPGTDPTESGLGYWAWSSCGRRLTMAGPGTPSLTMPLAGYRASMVANPWALGPVTVSGFDYAARWDPAAGGGAGGYVLSALRQPQRLAVGEGIWVFSFTDTTIRFSP